MAPVQSKSHTHRIPKLASNKHPKPATDDVLERTSKTQRTSRGHCSCDHSACKATPHTRAFSEDFGPKQELWRRDGNRFAVLCDADDERQIKQGSYFAPRAPKKTPQSCRHTSPSCRPTRPDVHKAASASSQAGVSRPSGSATKSISVPQRGTARQKTAKAASSDNTHGGVPLPSSMQDHDAPRQELPRSAVPNPATTSTPLTAAPAPAATTPRAALPLPTPPPTPPLPIPNRPTATAPTLPLAPCAPPTPHTPLMRLQPLRSHSSPYFHTTTTAPPLPHHHPSAFPSAPSTSTLPPLRDTDTASQHPHRASATARISPRDGTGRSRRGTTAAHRHSSDDDDRDGNGDGSATSGWEMETEEEEEGEGDEGWEFVM